MRSVAVEVDADDIEPVGILGQESRHSLRRLKPEREIPAGSAHGYTNTLTRKGHESRQCPLSQLLKPHPSYALAGPSFKDPHRPGLSAILVLAADILGLSLVLWAFLGNTIIGRYAVPGGWLPLWPILPLFLVLYWFCRFISWGQRQPSR